MPEFVARMLVCRAAPSTYRTAVCTHQQRALADAHAQSKRLTI